MGRPKGSKNKSKDKIKKGVLNGKTGERIALRRVGNHRGRIKGAKNVSTLEREAKEREWMDKNTLSVSWSNEPIIIEQETRKGEPQLHDLKTWPMPFRAMLQGLKLFDFRVDDRGFMVGDVLRLREWLPKEEKYTGNILYARINFILKGGRFGLPRKYVVMSIDLCRMANPGSGSPTDRYDPSYSFGKSGGTTYGNG